jgi:hypothetical protein
MSGSQATFSKLDAAIRGTVRFGDDSVAEIEGRGVVVFRCKNGKQRSFAGVYFIPRLKANIISVGQLDEAGYDIHIKQGLMSVHEPNGQLLARIERGRSRLYVLSIMVARAECLAMRGDTEVQHWHARPGHVNMEVLRKMSKEELVRKLPIIGQLNERCTACMAGK